MDIKRLEKKWRKDCPDEVNGMVKRRVKKRTRRLWEIREKGAEARKKIYSTMTASSTSSKGL
tara:strand:- start:252 stop:437 length:186 start_codon:yes stop_codon:yes gene_type:complete